MNFRRRTVLLSLATALAAPMDHARDLDALKKIRKRLGGRLGVHALDTQSGLRIGHDDGSRYAMASTFKLPLAAALLWQVDHGAFRIDHTLAISKADVVAHSPAVEAKLAAGATAMSVRELCEAVVVHSDNAAANVLITGMGGPQGLTQFFRSIGDDVSRLDRMEPALNANTSGDARDTTTPRAMVDTMLKIFTQDVLSLTSRAVLIDWMNASKRGLDRVRAGLPRGWAIGDKTGTGENGAINDLVIAYPPQRRPVLIAVYMSDSLLPTKDLIAAHAEIGGVLGKQFLAKFAKEDRG
jgi:beta-lactamase class A